MKRLTEQIQDAEQEAAASDSDNGKEEETDAEAEKLAKETFQSFQDVQERLSRYARLQEQAAQDTSDSKAAALDDPWWLSSFYPIMESVQCDEDIDNFQKPLRLVSGCSGMLAEGWICQADFLGHCSEFFFLQGR